MPIRTTIDIPEPLYDRLRQRAGRTGMSIRALVIRAIEQTYTEPKRGNCVTGPLIDTKGKRLGPRFPKTKNPHDPVLS